VQVQVAERHIVVASRAIPAGTALAPDMLRLQAWPAESLVPGSFATPEELTTRGVTVDILENEPITETKLATGTASGMQTLIPPGMRAMSIRVNDVIAVSGYAASGTHVDVLVIATPPNREVTSRVVVNNVQILAAGPDINQAAGQQGQRMPATVVTLLVTPQDGEKVALAQTQGEIMLALRNPLDVEPVETRGVRMSALIGEPDPPPVRRVVGGVSRVAPPPPPPAPPVYTVEQIRGAKREQVIIK
jgi:pilus assembly protein CpaB